MVKLVKYSISLSLIASVIIHIDLGYAANEMVTVGIGHSCGKTFCTDGTNDQEEINQAIRYLSQTYGGGTVVLDDGTYLVSNNVYLLDNITLKGTSQFNTIIKLANYTQLSNAGIIRVKRDTSGLTPAERRINHVTIEHLAIDGNKVHNPSKADGTTNNYLVYSEGNYITLNYLYAHDATGYGIDPHETPPKDSSPAISSDYLTISNCLVENNGKDGIVLDAVRYSSIFNNTVRKNSRHGINVVTASTKTVITANVIEQNGNGIEGNGITVQNDSIDLTISSNTITANSLAGISLRATTSNTIVGNQISWHSRQGIILKGASYSFIANNELYNNAQAANDTYNEIELQFYLNPTSRVTIYSHHNLINSNSIINDTSIKCRHGYAEKDSNEDYNFITGNSIVGCYRSTGIHLLSPNSKAANNYVNSTYKPVWPGRGAGLEH